MSTGSDMYSLPMRTWRVLLVTLSACGYPPLPNIGGDANIGGDSNIGGPSDARACFGSFVTVCFTVPADVPTMPVMIPGGTTAIDTGSSPMCDQHNDQMSKYCVVAGAGVTLSAETIRAYGAKPLILLSTSTITIDAQSVIDVSSHLSAVPLDPQTTGAGADSPACMSGAQAANQGGGYGGSFGGKGGNGEQVGGTMGGTSAQPLSPAPSNLRGGCPGGTGAASGGTGGSGGGAVALIAPTSIQIDGTVKASGAGGHGGPPSQSGGGGGGSGGMIVLDAPSITATGPLFANGGGGGQGGTGGAASERGVGADGGESSLPLTPAAGGYNSLKEGGAGGTGSAGTSSLTGSAGGPSGQGAIASGGGGGGGGGAGFIRAPGVTTNISPPSFVP